MRRIAGIVSLITVLIVVVLAISFAWKNSIKAMENFTVRNDLQKYGIEVVRPDNPVFNVELSKYIGDRNELIPMIESAKPFSLVIKNNSGKDIVGISLNWRFENSEGKTQNIERSISTPGVLMGMKVTDPSLIAKTSLLYNKDSQFFSFFPYIEQSIVNTRKSIDNPAIDFRLSSEEIKEDESQLALQKADIDKRGLKYSVDIDGVVFSDGTFIGKNENSFFEHLNGLIQARRDFTNKLRENRFQKVSDSDSVNQVISESSNKKETLIAANPKDKLSPQEVYQRSYESQLSDLYRDLKRKGTMMSDKLIIDSFISSKDSEFIPLKK